MKIDFDYWFGEHIKTRGKKKGEKGYGWTGPLGRWCTALKRDAMLKINKKIPNMNEFIGIASDEIKRTEKTYLKNRNIKLPLIDWQITEKQALEYCYAKGLDWGGLYQKMKRVSCWCCPLSSTNELRVIYNDFPELWQQLLEMDKKSVFKFKAGKSVDDYGKRFAMENMQQNMFG